METHKSLVTSRITITVLAIMGLIMAAGAAWALFGAFIPAESGSTESKATTEISELAFDPLSYAIDVSGVDRTNRNAVAQHFTEIATTWYPARDHSRTDAELRATGLMSEDKAQTLILPERPATGDDWTLWGKRNGYSIPNVDVREPLHRAESDNPDNEFVNVEVTVTYRWKAKGFDSQFVAEERVFYLAMREDPDLGWEVTDYLYDVLLIPGHHR
ncbi:hypothetical protein [Glutamicibacter uratoxydans]|uniref:hypothetical protein n=1 Tax=Glutamicibacter uratoxydans TaxID=43667 RepID=UPI003D6FFBE3